MTSKKDQARLQVIRAHMGADDLFSAGDITSRCTGPSASMHTELVNTLGPRLALSKRSLGHWLKRFQGAIVEGYRLSPTYDRKARMWRYEFISIAENATPEGAADWLEAMDVLDCEQRIEAPRAAVSRILIEAEKQVERATAREDAKKAERQFEQEQQQFEGALEDTRKHLTGAVTVGTDGQIRKEVLLDRNGEPIPEQPTAAPPVVQLAPAEAQALGHGAWVGRNASGTLVARRQPTRAELAARHKQFQSSTGQSRDDWFARACESTRRGFDL